MIGTSPQDQITAFLQGQGFTAAQIAGIEGNLQTESGFRSTASNPREGAIGIAQWEGGRRTALQSFARQAGTSETDLQTQLQFMMAELHGSEHAALAALTQQTTAAGAATAFDQKYERSSAASLPARVANANAILASGLKGGSGNVDTSGGGTQSLTASPAGLFGLPSFPAFSDIGRWVIDAFLIVAGLALVITGLVIITRATSGGDSDDKGETITIDDPGSSSSSHDSTSNTTTTTTTSAPASRSRRPANRSAANGSAKGNGAKKSAKGKVAGAAEDGAEVAAVAA